MENTKIINVFISDVIREARIYAPGYDLRTALAQYCAYLLLLNDKKRMKGGSEYQRHLSEYKIASKLFEELTRIDSLQGRN